MGRRNTTKAYYLVSSLLLLAHTSVAALSLSGLLKPSKTVDYWVEVLKKSPDAAEKIIEKIPNSPPTALPPIPSITPQRIQFVKQHLTNYGYLPDSDTQLKSAIQDYQQFFNLQVTGLPDTPTLQHMSLLRCAVPDKNFTFDLSTDNVSWPLGTQWFPKNKNNLTYGFAQADQIRRKHPIIIEMFADSFKRWSDAIKAVNFTETDYEDADIKIRFLLFKNIAAGREEVVGGSFIRLLSGKNVTFGDMFLDVSKNMVNASNNGQKGRADLESVVMHQIGHLLGLEHSSHEDSVMYPSILPSMQRKVELSKDDTEQIKQVYSSSSSSSSSSTTTGSHVANLAAASVVWGLLTATFSFALACLLLFY